MCEENDDNDYCTPEPEPEPESEPTLYDLMFDVSYCYSPLSIWQDD